MELGFDLRLRLRGTEVFFGPGVDQVLRLVERTGSLHTAAAEMGMSYTKAWRIVRRAEEQLGFPLLERRAGGAGGGFSRLTPRGADLLERYEALVEDLQDRAAGLFRQHFQDFGKDGQG